LIHRLQEQQRHLHLHKSWYSHYQRVHLCLHNPAWGRSSYGGTKAPSGSGYTKIYSTERAFAVLEADGSITAWGNSGYGGTGAPSGNGYTKIYANANAFAVLEASNDPTP
jgi:hypothetical protein